MRLAERARGRHPRRQRPAGFLLACVVAVSACDRSARVALVVDGDEQIRASASEVRVEVLAGGQRAQISSERLGVSGSGRLPREIPLEVPSESGVLRARLSVAGPDGAVLARRLVTLRLEPDGAVAVRVRLESACRGLRCDEERDLTCREGVCASSRPRPADLVERPTDESDLLALGQRLEARGEHDEALRVYVAAIHKYHNNFEAARRIGHIECFHRKDRPSCARWASRLVSLEPSSERANVLLVQERVLAARDALQAGDPERAERLAREASRRDPRNPDAPMITGRAAEVRGRVAEAAEAYRAALRLRPGRRAACARLAALLERVGRSDAATRWRACESSGRVLGPAAPP